MSSLGLKIWGILSTELKDTVFPTLSKRILANGFKRIVHVVYVKCTPKTLDFYKLSTRTSLLFNM